MLKQIGLKLTAGNLSSEDVTTAASSLSDSLSNLRASGQISNDAYLEAGVIQGGLSTLSNLIKQGVEQHEVELHISNLVTRAQHICEIHTDLKNYLLY